MAIEKINYIERVLISLNEDGSIKGAAKYEVTGIRENNEWVVPLREGAAQEVTQETLSNVLPSISSLIAQITKLETENEQLKLFLNEMNTQS